MEGDYPVTGRSPPSSTRNDDEEEGQVFEEGEDSSEEDIEEEDDEGEVNEEGDVGDDHFEAARHTKLHAMEEDEEEESDQSSSPGDVEIMINEADEDEDSSSGNQNDRTEQDLVKDDDNEETLQDHDVNEGKEPEQKNHQNEVTYSTRGRAAESSSEPPDRLGNETIAGTEEVGTDLGVPAASAALRESFLSDSLTEEERRTRTRYIPSVTGMHALRKNEVKGDLSLARAIPTSSGAATTLSKRRTGNKRGVDDGASGGVDEDAVLSAEDVATTGTVSPLEDERMADILRLGGKTIRLGTTDYSFPSNAFVAPTVMKSTATAKDGKVPRRSPREVESVTAFDPPRPPESVGVKKKHRLIRWERSPSDIEVDLNNYRKTVQRTQKELHNTQDELDRIQTVENHLRGHFLHFLRNVSEEMNALNRELVVVQRECVMEADLSTARTRNRGAGKGNVVMRDVLNVLKARGDELKARGYKFEAYKKEQGELAKGVGGVGAANFQDWDSSTSIQVQKLASTWIVPGEVVVSPYGQGNVVAVHPSNPLAEKKSPAVDDSAKESDDDAMEINPSSPVTGNDANPNLDTMTAAKKKKSPGGTSKEKTGIQGVRSPSIGVQLAYGIAYFPLETLKITENPSLFSDDRLASRWKGLHETAKAVASVLDLEAMSCIFEDHDGRRAESTMETNESVHDKVSSTLRKRRLLPFGAELLPSAHGRGNLLLSKSIEDLENAMEYPLYNGHGVAGTRNNRSVPNEMAAMESLSEDRLLLEAKVNHLKNKLHRQRRIRILNERTLASTQERAAKVESFVAEMKSDLRSLKARLGDEIRELGVTEEHAAAILASYSGSLRSEDVAEGTPSKRQRMRSDSNLDADMGIDEDAEDEVVEAFEVKQ